jgi:hypothetical protein
MQRPHVLCLSFASALLVAVAPLFAGTPLGTAFTYQGQLRLTGGNVNDNCDFIFTLFDDPAGGIQVGPTLTFDGVGGNPAPIAVVDGIFTVKLDFGGRKGDILLFLDAGAGRG